MEVSLTQVFDRPLRGREFFEEIMRDNLDLGRPDRVQLIFDRVVTKKTPGQFRTRVIQDGVHPSLHINYKDFDLKQYFKEGRACRTEGTFRNPQDFGINKGLANLPYLAKIGRQINRRLLEVERVSHHSGLSGDSIQRVVQPTVTEDGQKSPGLKFGQPRVMALFLALTLFQHLIDGFRNCDLRGQVADLLGVSRVYVQPDDLRLATAMPERTDLPAVRNTAIFRHPVRLESGPSILAAGSTCLPARHGGVHLHRCGLAISLRRALERVDAQLDELIYDAFPTSKAA